MERIVNLIVGQERPEDRAADWLRWGLALVLLAVSIWRRPSQQALLGAFAVIAGLTAIATLQFGTYFGLAIRALVHQVEPPSDRRMTSSSPIGRR